MKSIIKNTAIGLFIGLMLIFKEIFFFIFLGFILLIVSYMLGDAVIELIGEIKE